MIPKKVPQSKIPLHFSLPPTHGPWVYGSKPYRKDIGQKTNELKPFKSPCLFKKKHRFPSHSHTPTPNQSLHQNHRAAIGYRVTICPRKVQLQVSLIQTFPIPSGVKAACSSSPNASTRSPRRCPSLRNKRNGAQTFATVFGLICRLLFRVCSAAS